VNCSASSIPSVSAIETAPLTLDLGTIVTQQRI
jgi:hypothetical protein